jgi:nitrate/TMAO reductase-like tetraheme cytochrome c subunit
MSSTGNQATPSSPKRRRFRWLGRRLAIALLIVVLIAGGGMAGMEWYTGQPEFCGSCHIMQPYYKSWEVDVHATKAEAACIDCHYVPGERHTFQAKLRGLSQAVTYFSGRAGGRRPRPRVQDGSCLREGCHQTAEFIDKEYAVKDVKFVHTKHLQPDQMAADENRAKVAALQERLKGVLQPEVLERLDQLTIQLGDPNELVETVRRILESVEQAGLLQPAIDYVTFARRDIRHQQVAKNLRCTTCHAFSGTTEHFTTLTSACVTCHFVGQPFNTDTGECLTCHSPPQIEVVVHAKTLTETVGEARKAGTMDHSLIVEKNVDCRSCHADLVRGTGRVTRSRCDACHDLPEYFKEYDENLSPPTVEMLHDKHVGELHATCTDCHEVIEHRLRPKDAMQMAGGFLEPIRENCAHCHPNHHLFQVQMLTGQAPPPIPQGGANAMFGSRVNCLGCHTKETVDVKGTAVIEATRQACVICHEQDYQQLFDQWVSALDTRQREASGLLAHVEQVVAARGGIEQIPAEARQELDASRQTLAFVGSAKGIHNRNYALSLLDFAEGQLQQALRLMGEPVPTHMPSTAPATEPTAGQEGSSVYRLAGLVKCPMDPDVGVPQGR